MILDMLSDVTARERELRARTLEISHRMQWYDVRTIERLERELRTARSRLQIGSNLAAGAR